MSKNNVLLPALLLLASLALPASAKNLSATITGTDGRPMSGFVVSATAETVKLAANVQGQGGADVAQNTIAEITFNETPEGWNEAVQQYSAGDFEAAERSFSILAEEYKAIALLRDQYGAMARFYQLQSLKQNGRLPQLATALGQLKTSPIALSEHYMEQLKRLAPWGLAGKEDWDAVVAHVAEFQEQKGDRPRPSFKAGIPRSQIVELCYLRGLAHLNLGEKEAGLEDLYRALTLNHGSDPATARPAVEKALEQLKEADDEGLKREAYSVAVLQRDLFGEGKIGADYKHLLDNAPTPLPPAEEEKPAAPAAEKAPEAPADKAKTPAEAPAKAK